MISRSFAVAALLLAACLGATAQTTLIEHKSHSGTAASFSPDRSASYGFGEMPQMSVRTILKVIRLSDTTAVEVTSGGADTVFHHPIWNRPNVTVDSLRGAFPEISFEGWEETTDTVSSLERPGSPSSTRMLAMLGTAAGAVLVGAIAITKRGRSQA
jgi:hypothetical protein